MEPGHLYGSGRSYPGKNLAHCKRLELLPGKPAGDFQYEHLSVRRNVLWRYRRRSSNDDFVFAFSEDAHTVRAGHLRGRVAAGARDWPARMFCGGVLLRENHNGGLFTGQIIGTYLILYGTERGIIEFFRGDPGRTMMFHDTVSLMQLVSVTLILAGGFLWCGGLGRAPRPSVSSAGTTLAR